MFGVGCEWCGLCLAWAVSLTLVPDDPVEGEVEERTHHGIPHGRRTGTYGQLTTVNINHCLTEWSSLDEKNH